MRGSSWVPHHTGTLPIFGPACPNLESSEAMIKSHNICNSLPPPTAYPLTRAMIGLPQPRMLSDRLPVRGFIRAAAARAECLLARPGQHDDADSGVGLGGRKRRDQVVECFLPEGVVLLRPVDRDPCDAVGGLVQHIAQVHACPLL